MKTQPERMATSHGARLGRCRGRSALIFLLALTGAATACFAQSGVLDPTFNPVINLAADPPIVRGIALASGGRVVIGGSFANINDHPFKCLAVLQSDGTLDPAYTNQPYNIAESSAITAVGVATNGYYVVSGLFGGVPTRYLTRIKPTGQPDLSFPATASQPNGAVDSLLIAPDNKVLIGGIFTSPRARLARLLDNGNFDFGFNPGNVFSNSVRALALQPDGKILAGSFGVLSRLNTNGTSDATFNAGAGPNNEVYAITVQPDGKILVGGLFTEFDGAPLPFLVRLTSAGALDPSFTGAGTPNYWVRSIVLQPDGRILIAGGFSQVGLVQCNYIARLTGSGELDPAFCPGATMDNIVLAAVRQTNGLIVTGGQFLNVNGTPRTALARLGGTDMLIRAIQMGSDGVASLSLSGQSGLAFSLDASEDLTNWTSICTAIWPASPITVPDPDSPNHPGRFYRARSQ